MGLKFPRMVYVCPGPHQCEGGSFDFEVVKDQSEHDAAIKAGFSLSVPDALEARVAALEAEARKPQKAKGG